MKGSILLVAAGALTALASPIRREVVVTDVDVQVAVDTVTVMDTVMPATTAVDWTTSTVTGAPAVDVKEAPATSVPAPAPPPAPTTTAAPAPPPAPTTTAAPAPPPAPTTTAAPAPPPPAEPASSTSSSASPAATYQSLVLDSHNVHRANHSAPALTWNATLAESALALANTCNYGHNTHLGPAANYGQNIGMGVPSTQVDQMITNLMYNDEMMNYQDYYGQATPSMSGFDGWGHFSQIVWQNTQSVGCATVTCDPLQNTGYSMSLPFTVCNYFPAGNYEGEYGQNVLQPKGQPMVIAP